jgi:hypothetical protein
LIVNQLSGYTKAVDKNKKIWQHRRDISSAFAMTIQQGCEFKNEKTAKSRDLAAFLAEKFVSENLY